MQRNGRDLKEKLVYKFLPSKYFQGTESKRRQTFTWKRDYAEIVGLNASTLVRFKTYQDCRNP